MSTRLPAGFAAHAATDAVPRVRYAPEYRIRASLEDAASPIWRLLIVPGDLTLRQIHHVLQLVFGWKDSRLHASEAGPVDIGMPDDEEPFPIDDRVVRLDAVARRAKTITYVYDFGDDWRVELSFEARRDTQKVDAPAARLRCLE